MFRKRQKKTFPPGTFIPTPSRVAAILHLCLAFVVILSTASYPFLGELFTNKAKALLYHDVMGSSANENSSAETERLSRNAHRFAALPAYERINIVEQYRELQETSQSSFLQKVERSFSILFAQLPAFKQVWIALSVVIPLLLLLRVEGSNYVVWLLPIVTLCYAYTNYTHGTQHTLSAEERLFPTEETIIHDYLQKPLSANILEQQQQLQHGWHLYLIEKWGKQTPSNDPNHFAQQVEEGEFAFNLARIHASNTVSIAPYRQREHPLTLLIYLLWNGAFALIITLQKPAVNRSISLANN